MIWTVLKPNHRHLRRLKCVSNLLDFGPYMNLSQKFRSKKSAKYDLNPKISEQFTHIHLSNIKAGHRIYLDITNTPCQISIFQKWVFMLFEFVNLYSTAIFVEGLDTWVLQIRDLEFWEFAWSLNGLENASESADATKGLCSNPPPELPGSKPEKFRI